MKKNSLMSIIVACMLLLCLPISVFAQEQTEEALAQEQRNETYLIQKGVPQSYIDQLESDEIRSFALEAQAYRLSDEELAEYIAASIEGKQRVDNASGSHGVLNKEQGYVIKNGERFAAPPMMSTEKSSVTPLAVNSYTTFQHPGDNGVGWIATANPGYIQATSYVNLPTIPPTSGTNNSVPYLMFGVYSDKISMDIGLRYVKSLNKFVPFRGSPQLNPQWYEAPVANYIDPSLGQVYFNLKRISNTQLQFIIFGGGREIWNYTFSVPAGAINSTGSNAKIHHGFTVAQFGEDKTEHSTLVKGNGGVYDSNDGMRVQNAGFSQMYLYTASNYYILDSNRTYSAEKFTPNSAQAGVITLNSYSPWHTVNLSVNLTTPCSAVAKSSYIGSKTYSGPSTSYSYNTYLNLKGTNRYIKYLSKNNNTDQKILPLWKEGNFVYCKFYTIDGVTHNSGYVQSSYLTFTPSSLLSSLPTFSPTQLTRRVQYNNSTVYSMYWESDSQYRAKLPSGTVVKYLSPKKIKNYAFIEYTNPSENKLERGWIWADNLTT